MKALAVLVRQDPVDRSALQVTLDMGDGGYDYMLLLTREEWAGLRAMLRHGAGSIVKGVAAPSLTVDEDYETP